MMEVRAAKYVEPTNTLIDCEINHPKYGWIPYTINPADTDDTINNQDLLDQIGDNIEPYVPPSQAELDRISTIEARKKRDALLEEYVDPIAGNNLRWAELTEMQKSEMSSYRLALLDVPQQAGFPRHIDWPQKPQFME